MKATDLLKKQHEKVDALFARFEKAKKAADKAAIFEEIAQNLVAHDAIEREIFYPACEEAMGMNELLGESLVEHGLVEFMLYRADQNAQNDTLAHHVKVLQEVVEHHVEEEEEELFPKVEDAIEASELEDLGIEMKQRFEEALLEDFRPLLLDNLTQVLDGAMKTAPGEGVDTDDAPAPTEVEPTKKRKTSTRAHA
ncbi:MAG: hemerythrin domain-containing protein [Myxococcales bacterium]|nr:hemerythrin domain-containing protein [Myxococcales bacterium]